MRFFWNLSNPKFNSNKTLAISCLVCGSMVLFWYITVVAEQVFAALLLLPLQSRQRILAFLSKASLLTYRFSLYSKVFHFQTFSSLISSSRRGSEICEALCETTFHFSVGAAVLRKNIPLTYKDVRFVQLIGFLIMLKT